MLQNVHVKNLALIEETEINLNPGFNILTGETGAGKSIIIDSINCCLGGKATKDFIREGAEQGLVELVFVCQDSAVNKYVKDNDIATDEEGVYILSRRIMQARSIYRINGETVTANQMKEFASLLIDIHGQHEHQSLLSEAKQEKLLDGFLGTEAQKLLEKINGIYSDYNSVIKEIENCSIDESKREREISLARFEVEEIENASLREGELDELTVRHKKLVNSQRIMENLSRVKEILQGEDGIIDRAGYAVKDLNMAAAFDEELENVCSLFSDAEQILEDASRELSAYMDSFEFDGQDFADLEERLNLLNHLSMKYGGDVKQIQEYCEKKKEELEKLENLDSYIKKQIKESELLQKEYDDIAGQLHAIRCVQAKVLSRDIENVLKDLNFLKVEFEILVEKTDDMRANGRDRVVFLISLNPGEKKRPLSQVASGGELSRVMLALKSVLAERDNIETLIFDEIDAGISGVTAWQVSKCMGRLSRSRQVICITHLPQIAAMADTHFKIEKSENQGKTRTEITGLSEEQRIQEVARLLGADHASEAALANAAALIEDGIKEKNSAK